MLVEVGVAWNVDDRRAQEPGGVFKRVIRRRGHARIACMRCTPQGEWIGMGSFIFWVMRPGDTLLLTRSSEAEPRSAMEISLV